jgi:hypothetical protein
MADTNYIINYGGDTPTTINIAPDSLDETTSLQLFGKQYRGYGTGFWTNLVRLLENFNSIYEPRNPVAGQLWFDGNRLLVCKTKHTTAAISSANYDIAIADPTRRTDYQLNQSLISIASGSQWALVNTSTVTNDTLTAYATKSYVDGKLTASNVKPSTADHTVGDIWYDTDTNTSYMLILSDVSLVKYWQPVNAIQNGSAKPANPTLGQLFYSSNPVSGIGLYICSGFNVDAGGSPIWSYIGGSMATNASATNPVIGSRPNTTFTNQLFTENNVLKFTANDIANPVKVAVYTPGNKLQVDQIPTNNYDIINKQYTDSLIQYTTAGSTYIATKLRYNKSTNVLNLLYDDNSWNALYINPVKSSITLASESNGTLYYGNNNIVTDSNSLFVISNGAAVNLNAQIYTTNNKLPLAGQDGAVYFGKLNNASIDRTVNVYDNVNGGWHSMVAYEELSLTSSAVPPVNITPKYINEILYYGAKPATFNDHNVNLEIATKKDIKDLLSHNQYVFDFKVDGVGDLYTVENTASATKKYNVDGTSSNVTISAANFKKLFKVSLVIEYNDKVSRHTFHVTPALYNNGGVTVPIKHTVLNGILVNSSLPFAVNDLLDGFTYSFKAFGANIINSDTTCFPSPTFSSVVLKDAVLYINTKLQYFAADTYTPSTDFAISNPILADVAAFTPDDVKPTYYSFAVTLEVLA